ncbi:putative trehalose-phosphate phosphatase 10 [Quercus suber]|uniref:Trehalose 6-phosphate phosphatase n=1 Tax=Quercus suber TaxID=58331 RepID=A0AAW0M6P8_QUESU
MVYPQLPSGPLNMESNSEESFHDNEDVIDDFYDIWLKNHPSALSSFEEIKSVAHEKQMVVFLDYDGTLSPIVNNPDQAFMSTEMRSAVREIGEHFPTAIISGRSRDKVFQFVRLNNIYYAGSHGMDISTPSVSLNYGNHKHQTRTIDEKMRSAVREIGEHFPTAIISGRSRDKVFQFVRLNNIYYAGSHGMDISTPSVSLNYGNHEHQTRTIDEKGNDVVNFCPVRDFLPRIQTIKDKLEKIAKDIKGASVEDNKFCLSVHFRCVNEEIKDKLEKIAKDIKGASVEDNKFCLSVHFRCVNEENVGKLKEMVESTMEFYNDFRITEGKKVMEIRPIINWDKGRALQYLLDTLGFENSSNVLPIYIGDDKTDEDAFKMIKSIGRGFPVAVSTTPKETEALYSLRDPTEVMSFLILLAKWKMGCTLVN